jgi:hypothetical protein
MNSLKLFFLSKIVFISVAKQYTVSISGIYAEKKASSLFGVIGWMVTMTVDGDFSIRTTRI